MSLVTKEEWLKDPWKYECYVYCPYKDTAGCAVCEKLGHSEDTVFNCYECRSFMKFPQPLKNDRYTTGQTCYGICKEDFGLIAYPKREYCVGKKLHKIKNGDTIEVWRYKDDGYKCEDIERVC